MAFLGNLRSLDGTLPFSQISGAQAYDALLQSISDLVITDNDVGVLTITNTDTVAFMDLYHTAHGFLAPMTITTTGNPSLTIVRAAADAAIAITNDAETVYIGVNDSDLFAIDDDTDLTTGPAFTVDPVNGHVVAEGNITSNSGDLTITTGDATLTAGDLILTTGVVQLPDGITAPATVAGKAQVYVDSADGDLKVKFGDGFVATLAADS